jgi:hypothetical protein
MSPGTSKEASSSDSLAQFSVFVLGTRGAGKTVFVSSMYRRLMVYSNKRGYFLRCTNDRLSAELIGNFSEIERTDSGWPPSTQSACEYIFDCAYVSKFVGAPNTICRFSYVDFPGGWVTGEGAATFSVQERAQASDSILVLLDGKKIKDHMDGVRDASRPILDEVLLMTPTIQACAAARKPIHFLITKADLLPPSTYQLRRIQDELFRIVPFRELLEHQSRLAPIRMVPVSAVGDNFAWLDPTTGKMEKKPGAFARPYNIDVSLSLTVYDHLKILADGLDARISSEIARGRRTIEVIDAVRRIAESAASWSVIATIVHVLGPNVLGAMEIIKGIDYFLGKSRDKIDNKIQTILETVDDQKSAFGAVLAIQALLMQRFEERLPDSNLNKRLVTL